MDISRNTPSRFSRYLWITVAAFVLLSIAFAVYVRAEKQISAANASRIQSLLLARELRRSTEDLTRMVRTYVITGDPGYKEAYQEILDIRDGKKPRPANYNDMYWGLQQRNASEPQPEGAHKIALLGLIAQTGVPPEELSLLKEAKVRSDALTHVEFSAMRLVESTWLPTDANRLKASEMLHDAAYHQAKAGIIQPISEFYRMMDVRTLNAVHRYERWATFMRMAFIAIGFFLLLALRQTYRELQAILGGSVDELHRRIARIGMGDFSSPGMPATGEKDDSVLGWLAVTQKNLAGIDAARKKSEAENLYLTRLYKMLSECNQAIARCKNEAELFPQICRSVVDFDGIDMAWIGMIDHSARQIRSIAAYGRSGHYPDSIVVPIDASEKGGMMPSARCAREDRPVWSQDLHIDPAAIPWTDQLKRFGWRGAAALPLHRGDVHVAVMVVYVSTENVFDETTRSMLTKLAMDIDYALNRFEQERQRQQALTALAESRGLLKTIIDTAPVRIYWKDRNLHYLGCNPAFARDAQLASPEDVVGKSNYQLVIPEEAERYQAEDRQIIETGVSRLFYDEHRDASISWPEWVRKSKVPLRNNKNEIIGLLGVYEDITEQKRAEARIQYLANYDALTGLPSRALLSDHLQYAMAIARRGNGQLALMFLDLDHFKDINDALGHSIGDAVLIELSKRLRQAVREEDTVARLGGDEFILLFPAADAATAAHVAQKLLDAIVVPFHVGQYALNLTASIGIAIHPNDGADLETLSRSADTAMYRAKKEGRRSYRFSTPDMQARSARNLQLVSAMHEALEHDQFEVYYQPHVSLHDGRIVGAEALLRWHHPEFGNVSPAEFIPVAEESGLILPLGESVLRSAVRSTGAWSRDGHGPLVIAVNLSVVQFRHPDLPNLVMRILDEEGFPPELLELELTESVAMTTPQKAIAMMEDLHDKGILMAIDDFGTGYSSLSYIKKFKVHKLKIDQSFISHLHTDQDDRAIVGAIIQMAKHLGLKTIAEGVESADQLAYLQDQGCDEVQGYYYSKPLSKQEFSAFLAGR